MPCRLLVLGGPEPFCEQVIGKHVILKLGTNKVKRGSWNQPN